MSEKPTLYSYQSPNYKQKWVRLEQTIEKFKPYLDESVALFYSSTKLQILQIKGNSLEDYNGHAFNNFSKIFEAIIFNPTCELRWLNRKCGDGQAVVLSENKITAPDCFEEKKKKYQEVLPQQYLLWGEVVPWDRVILNDKKYQEGWQRLTEARMGKIDVPVQGQVKGNPQIYLKTCEYLATIDKYGNMGVIEERLIKLEV